MAERLAGTQRWNKVTQPVLVVNGDASFPFMPAEEIAPVVMEFLLNNA